MHGGVRYRRPWVSKKKERKKKGPGNARHVRILKFHLQNLHHFFALLIQSTSPRERRFSGHFFDAQPTMSNTVVRVNPLRARTWLTRLPFCTRLVFLLIVALSVASFLAPWIPQAGALIPSEVSLLSSELASWNLKE